MRDMSTRFHETDSQTYAVGFDGVLRLLLTTVRVSPSLGEAGVSCVAMVRDSGEAVGDEKRRRQSKRDLEATVLVEADGRLLHGEQDLYRLLHHGSSKTLKSMESICLSRFSQDLFYLVQIYNLSH